MKHRSFVCQNCGYSSPKWLGRCPMCGSWNSLVEETVEEKRNERKDFNSTPLPITEVEGVERMRYSTGIGEFDRVLGGGVVKGSVVLIGGEPGIGKSTLMLHLSKKMCEQGIRVFYITGEESTQQVKMRAERLNAICDNIYILSTTDIEEVIFHVESLNPDILIVDSIQTMFSQNLDSGPGTVAQVRECTYRLDKISKKYNITVFLIGHVTKKGIIAGPKTLEHMVDTVLYFEGDRFHQYRIIRCVKNRFGSTNEVGIFEMWEKGLREVKNPSLFFIGDSSSSPGSVITSIIEGTRAFLVEVQTLATSTYFTIPQRVITGMDMKRVQMLIGLLEKRYGIATSRYDIFVNVPGGIKIDEPSADLAFCIGVVSSIKDYFVTRDTLIIGEVGLGGEVRGVSRMEDRLKEGRRLGFKKFIIPYGNFEGEKEGIIEVKDLGEAIEIVMGG